MSKKIGRYEIRQELGRGAQSVVYLANDPQLQRDVAIKTLHFTKPNPDQNKMLLSEARMVSKLQHPNIVPIFDAGEEGGDVYLVFEYIPGKNLSDFLHAGGPVPAEKAVLILRQVLDAISAAHAKGIIHRDLKPSNILLDESEMPRVMDFGIASRVETEGLAQREEMIGTPSYMAPEYVDKRIVDARTDVFAAGLILYEMLTGKRAVTGSNVFQILHQLTNQDIRLPQSGSASVDDQLAGLLYKALARDPEMRYQSAAQFSEALDKYLEPESGTKPAGKQATLDFLLRRMRHKSDFPALSESVSAINKIASSEKESINKLSNAILKDFSLTNKILKLVNSAYFRPAGGGSISTVSRAVIVMGFEAVRNIAITVLLFEHMQNKSNVAQLKEEFLRANLAGIIGKNICVHSKLRDLEQIFICSMFQNLGRLLAQFYFPEESEEIRRILAQKPCSDDQAALQVLGITHEDLGMAIAEQWGFPTLIQRSMRSLPSGNVRLPHTQEDRMQVLSCFCNELCVAIATSPPETCNRETKKILARFGSSVPLNENELQEILFHAIGEVSEFANIIRINLKQTAFGRQIRQFASGEGGTGTPDRMPLETSDTDGFGGTVLLPCNPLEGIGEPGFEGDEPIVIDAQSVLTAGIQDISNTLVEGFKLNDILRIILETMYRAMGFKRVILCIKDVRANTMQGRFGFGPETQEIVKKFRFPLKQNPDIFYAATLKGADLLISNVDDEKIASRVPDWFRGIVPAKTFLLLPLNIKGNPVALIYADKDNPGEIVIPEKELSLLRTLRNQAILAIKQGT